MAKSYIVVLSDAEDKALGVVSASQQDWIDNAVHNRCRIAIDEIVDKEIKRKLDAGETISGSKEDIVMAANIKSLAEQSEDAQQSLAAQNRS